MTTRCVAAADVTLNGLVIALVRLPLEACRAYPEPEFFRVRPENVATPFTAARTNSD